MAQNPLHWAGIANSIVDLWSAIAPGFAIVDGVVGMEGDGPIMGDAVASGALFFGANLPAVDATAARFMGLRAERLSFLQKAVGLGGTLSPLRIEVAGDALAAQSFAVLDHLAHLRA